MLVHPEILCVGPEWGAGSSSPGVCQGPCVCVCEVNLGKQCPVTHPQQVTALLWSCLLLFLHQPSLPALLFPGNVLGWAGQAQPVARLSQDSDPWANSWRWAGVLRESICSSEPEFGEGIQGELCGGGAGGVRL